MCGLPSEGPLGLSLGTQLHTCGRTVVVAVALLFALFWSVCVAETVAVFVIVPFWVGLTTIVTVSRSPLCNVPRLHVTTFLCLVHVPFVVLTEPKPALFGRLSTKVV